jgi:uncharacterized membrane protein YsdA (DUF1294 family)
VPLLPTALAWLLLVNGWTFLRFRQDKRRAERREWRVSESDLLALAFFGGTPAAFAARHLLRHKTRKEPFSTYLQLIATLQTGAAIGLAVAFA